MRARYGTIARVYALIFGLAYLAVAVVEDLVGTKGFKFSGHIVLRLAGVQNGIHWAVAVIVLGSFFAGEIAAKMVARIIGVAFVALTVWGLVARDSLGKFLGFHGGKGRLAHAQSAHLLPQSYNIIHALTAVAALFAGFAATRVYGRRH